jgi:predicted NUDIX family NTP pyrophosphohydrolase
VVKSAGILLYRFTDKLLEVLLVHPGGPFWAKKDSGAWSIPKGEFYDDEEPLTAAIREFMEETGMQIKGDFIPLTPIRQKSGKFVYAFALEHDLDSSKIKSNIFTLEWPPKSGKQQEFPEIDKAEWFDVELGKKKINQYQAAFIKELEAKIKAKAEAKEKEKSNRTRNNEF